MIVCLFDMPKRKSCSQHFEPLYTKLKRQRRSISFSTTHEPDLVYFLDDHATSITKDGVFGPDSKMKAEGFARVGIYSKKLDAKHFTLLMFKGENAVWFDPNGDSEPYTT